MHKHTQNVFLWFDFEFYLQNIPASGKKKKQKGKTLNLNEFLADEASGAATTVTVKPVSWADEMENNEFDGKFLSHTHRFLTRQGTSHLLFVGSSGQLRHLTIPSKCIY